MEYVTTRFPLEMEYEDISACNVSTCGERYILAGTSWTTGASTRTETITRTTITDDCDAIVFITFGPLTPLFPRNKRLDNIEMA